MDIPLAHRDRLIEREELAGHLIEFRIYADGSDRLTIDGTPHLFFRVGNTFSLAADAYATPQRTLMDAARAYVRRQLYRAEK